MSVEAFVRASSRERNAWWPSQLIRKEALAVLCVSLGFLSVQAIAVFYPHRGYFCQTFTTSLQPKLQLQLWPQLESQLKKASTPAGRILRLIYGARSVDTAAAAAFSKPKKPSKGRPEGRLVLGRGADHKLPCIMRR